VPIVAVVLSARAVLVRIAVTTTAVAVIGLAAVDASIVAIQSTGQVVSAGVEKWETCRVMQASPCNRLSPAVLAADTGLQLPAGTKVLRGDAGRYFPREDRFSLSATISIPSGTNLQPAPSVVLRDEGVSADGRRTCQISMQIS
jgi:hypothetical protein